MSDRDPPHSDDDDGSAWMLATAGMLAGGVAGELSRPIRELRELLAVVVDSLDHHVSTAKGPTPYSWKQLAVLREQMAEAYLMSRGVARLAGDLAAAVATTAEATAPTDVNKALESALNLARHRVTEQVDVFMDFGAVPTARSVRSRLVLALARLIAAAGDATADQPDGEIHLRTRRVGDDVVVTVQFTGGSERAVAAATDAARPLAVSAGATLQAEYQDDLGGSISIAIPGAHG